jgi:RNA polymerase sigma factor (sigma-70 family)
MTFQYRCLGPEEHFRDPNAIQAGDAGGITVSHFRPISPFAEELAARRTLVVGTLVKLKRAVRGAAIDEDSDLVQFVMERAWKCRGQFQGQSIEEFVSWLNEVTRTVFFDRLRHNGAAKRAGRWRKSGNGAVAPDGDPLTTLIAVTSSTPSVAAQRKEAREELLRALERLPDDQRFVVIHRFLAGQTIKEICEEFAHRDPSLTKTEKAVASLIERGLTNLRRMMAGAET